MEPNSHDPTQTTHGVAAFFEDPIEQKATRELFLFDIDQEIYAVSVGDVELVMKIPPITAVPNAPESIVGIFHMRGRVVVVLDLLKRMHFTRAAGSAHFLFVSHHKDNYFAILVDRTRTVLRVPTEEIGELDPVMAAHIPPKYAKGTFMFRENTAEFPHKGRQSIMIEPEKVAGETTEPTYRLRPVLWLNMDELLDQGDILAASKEAKVISATPSTEPFTQGGGDML